MSEDQIKSIVVLMEVEINPTNILTIMVKMSQHSSLLITLKFKSRSISAIGGSSTNSRIASSNSRGN